MVLMSDHTIKRIRRKNGLRCLQCEKFKATTNSNHSLPVVENLIMQNFQVKVFNKIWVADITYIPTSEGRLFLATESPVPSLNNHLDRASQYCFIEYQRLLKMM